MDSNGCLILMQKILLRSGYGIGFHPTHKRYWPFVIENDGDGTIYWWHDPEDVDDENFTRTIEKLYGHYLGQELSL